MVAVVIAHEVGESGFGLRRGGGDRPETGAPNGIQTFATSPDQGEIQRAEATLAAFSGYAFAGALGPGRDMLLSRGRRLWRTC